MNHGSLFSGIGGFDLAATWMNWENIFQCEKDPFCRRILQYHWPEADCYEDVTKFKAKSYKGRVDILSGGFPCQPFSAAGKAKRASGEFARTYPGDPWKAFPSESPVCSGNDGHSERLDGIAFSKWRKVSIKGAGNAIVPQVAWQIFRVIEGLEYDLKKPDKWIV